MAGFSILGQRIDQIARAMVGGSQRVGSADMMLPSPTNGAVRVKQRVPATNKGVPPSGVVFLFVAKVSIPARDPTNSRWQWPRCLLG
jgi:hypothetical protein